MVPFKVEWQQADVERLLDRVKACDLPDGAPGAGWAYGCDAAFLRRLQRYWTEAYDWRGAVETLNRYPQFRAEVDGLDIHFVHVVGEAQGRRPLLLTHGWPGSHYEFWDVIEPLAFPSRFGGRAEDAFDLVIPSLPGFAFSGKPAQVLGQRATAALWNKLMTQALGYPGYRAQGGDWGAIVTSWLALDHPGCVEAIHLNMLAFRSMDPPASEAEGNWLRAAEMGQKRLGAYAALHTTRPQSLVWATAGNPLGQAAWIAERFHDWADLRRRDFEQVFSMDQLLTNIMLYVMTDSFASSVWFYPGIVKDGSIFLPHGTRCEVPTAFADMPGDASQPPPPRSRVELTYQVSRWSTAPEGGHFAAMEVPGWFVEDVRAWGRG